MKYQDINAQTTDAWVADGWEWGRPIAHETYQKALQGEWNVFLTPTKPVPHAWFGNLRGKRVLGLASGGAQQMPVFAALGAACTVLDYSPRQLESERVMAEREGYEIRIIRADMTEPLPFENGEFDLIFHPVSNCYVREVRPIWRECLRVLKHGGVLLAGLDNGLSFVLDEAQRHIVHKLPFDPLAENIPLEELARANEGVQFSHTLEEQIGGQLEAGFCLTHVYEDTYGDGYLHDMNIPAFWASRAIKP